MGRDPGRSVKHVSYLMGRMDAVVAVAVVHHISWAAARPTPSFFQMMGRGPARPIKFLDAGPRPVTAHHILEVLRPGQARPIAIFMSDRPGPARTTGP